MDPITAYLVRLGLPVQTAQQTAAKLLGPNPGAMLAATRREPSVTPLDPRADYRIVFGIDPPPGFTDLQIAEAVDERVKQNVTKTDQNQRSGMTVTPLNPREDYRIVFGVDPPERNTDREVADAVDAQIQHNVRHPSKYTPPKVPTDKVTGPAIDAVHDILGLKNASEDSRAAVAKLLTAAKGAATKSAPNIPPGLPPAESLPATQERRNYLDLAFSKRSEDSGWALDPNKGPYTAKPWAPFKYGVSMELPEKAEKAEKKQKKQTGSNEDVEQNSKQDE